MSNIRKGLNFILQGVTGVSFLAMVALTFWQVIARYVLKNPSPWSEELVSYLFAWASLFGACLVTGEREHMNIPVVVERFSKFVQRIFAIGAEIVAFLFSVVILVYGGVQITELAMGQLTSSLGIAVGVFYIILPLSGVINAAYTVLNLYDIFKNKEVENKEVESEAV